MKKITAKIISGSTTIYIRNNIDSAEIECLTKGNLSNIIDYGIYSNKGTISFFDYDKSFHNLMQKKPSNVTVEAYVSNPVSDKLIGTFLIDDYDYDNETMLVNLELKDKLIYWQSVPISDLYFFNTMSLYAIITKILEKVGINETDVEYSNEAKDILRRIRVYCPRINAGTLWSAINDICQVSMCRVCCNEFGKPKFYYDAVESNASVLITPKDIIQVGNQIQARNNRVYSAVIPFKKRTKYSDSAGDVLLSVNSISLTNGGTNIDITFVGNDTVRNNESYIEPLLLESFNKYKVSTTIGLKANIFSVDGILLNASGYIKPSGKLVYETTTDLPMSASDVDKIYNREKNDVQTTFTFTKPDLYNNVVLEKIRVGIKARYYMDGEDANFYTNLNASRFEDVQLASNDLMQTQNEIDLGDDDYENIQPYHDWLVEKIRSRFFDGVNCCEIDCLVVDYYATNVETLMINGNNKSGISETFSLQDVVVPYVTKNGASQPYKTKSDGSDMAFAVVGIKYLYNGILTQKLLLQEQT